MKVVYKIVAIVLALAVFPAAVFAPFVKIVVVSGLSSLLGNNSSVVFDESFSLYGLYEKFFVSAEGGEKLDVGAVLGSLPDNVKEQLGTKFFVFLALFVLVLLTSIALVVVIILTKQKKKGVIITAGIGAGLTFALNAAFNSFAKPLVSGVVPLTDLLTEETVSIFASGGLAKIASALAPLLSGSSSLLSLRLFSLGSVYILILLAFVAVMVWSVAYVLIDWE